MAYSSFTEAGCCCLSLLMCSLSNFTDLVFGVGARFLLTAKAELWHDLDGIELA